MTLKHKLFPTPLDPSAELYETQIKYVMCEFAPLEGGFILHVRPHYVGGAPQCLANATDLAEVAKNEYDAYLKALSGEYGRAAADEAQKRGLEHIIFITWRTPAELEVYDVLTRQKYNVPHDFKFRTNN